MRTINELIEEYKVLAKNCYQPDYNDKKSLKKNNDSVKRMYRIVETVNHELGPQGVSQLATLLDIEEYQTNLWIAAQLLEKVTLAKTTEQKALTIIEKVAKGDDALALGFQYWMKDWKSKRHK